MSAWQWGTLVLSLLPWKWKQYASSKRWYPSSEIRSLITENQGGWAWWDHCRRERVRTLVKRVFHAFPGRAVSVSQRTEWVVEVAQFALSAATVGESRCWGHKAQSVARNMDASRKCRPHDKPLPKGRFTLYGIARYGTARHDTKRHDTTKYSCTVSTCSNSH